MDPPQGYGHKWIEAPDVVGALPRLARWDNDRNVTMYEYRPEETSHG